VAAPFLVPVAEPTSPLWQRVRALVEWPRTNEAVVSALAEDWRRGGQAFDAASRHDVGAVRNSWSDEVSGTFVARAGTNLSAAGEDGTGMAALSGRTAAFAGEVARVKTDISDHVAANEGTFATLGMLPFGMAGPAQDWFVAQVATDVDQMIATGADRVSAMGDEPDEGFLEWLNERAGEVGGDIGEAAGELGDWLGGMPGEVGSWIGDQAAELGDAIRGEDRLEAAAVDVNVDAITPEPIWRDSDEPLYRSDDRGPDEVFDAGLGPTNADNLNLESHAIYDQPSAFVATSTNEDLYRHPEYRDRDYRYTINAPGGIDVGSTLPETRDRHPGEDEISFPGGVATRYIEGAHVVNHDGTLGEWIPNKAYNPD
jgi:hypothetical protein